MYLAAASIPRDADDARLAGKLLERTVCVFRSGKGREQAERYSPSREDEKPSNPGARAGCRSGGQIQCSASGIPLGWARITASIASASAPLASLL
jgi:hypothetical protein